MTEPQVADRRTLVSEIQTDDHALVLRVPVMLEAGDRFWIDLDESALVVEHDDVRSVHAGDLETRCR